MKTSLFALFLVGSLMSVVACSPSDPAVLTPQEKAKFGPKGNNGSFSQAGKAQIPRNLDAAYAGYLLDRQSEVLLFLKTALMVVNGDALPRVDGCVETIQQDLDQNSILFILDFTKCRTGGLEQNGRLVFTLGLNEKRQLKTLVVESAPIEDNTLSSRHLLYGSGYNKADIREQILVKLARISENFSSFRVLEATTVAHADITYDRNRKLSAEHVDFSTKTSGTVYAYQAPDRSFVMSHQLRTNLDYNGKAEGGDPRGTFFQMEILPNAKRLKYSNQETLGVCAAREGEVSIRFDFVNPWNLRKDKDTVIYNPTEIQVVRDRTPSNSLIKDSCDTGKASKVPFAGFNAVDWSKILVF